MSIYSWVIDAISDTSVTQAIGSHCYLIIRSPDEDIPDRCIEALDNIKELSIYRRNGKVFRIYYKDIDFRIASTRSKDKLFGLHFHGIYKTEKAKDSICPEWNNYLNSRLRK